MFFNKRNYQTEAGSVDEKKLEVYFKRFGKVGGRTKTTAFKRNNQASTRRVEKTR